MPLVLERTIPLEHVSGRIDHMAVDLARKRLFVAELGNGTLDVIDLPSGRVVHRIEDLREPQGVGYASNVDIIAVANGGDGSVRLYRGADYSPAGTVDLGDDADNVRLDARAGLLVVGFGSGGLAVIDPATARLTTRIPLQDHPEGFQLDPGRHRAIVNVPDARQIAVVDTMNSRQVATWQMPGPRANFPMALDETGTMVAVMFRNPPRLVVLDATTGRPINDMESCGDADDVFFDARRRRIYASCGAGAIDVWQQETGGLRPLGSVRTSSGARTSLFVPELDRLFVAARGGIFGLGSGAGILVFRPAGP